MSAVVSRVERDLTESAALQIVSDHAQAADSGERGLAGDMALLGDCGLLTRLCRAEPGSLSQTTLLRRLGRANLSVGRLAEGHMNALRLITLYGSVRQRRNHLQAADSGVIYGVWGADGERPVRIDGELAGGVRLCGTKRFASGLGTVGRAVVSAATPSGTRLAVAKVDDASRADASVWNTSGMRATASGTYDFECVEAEPLGGPGDYEREPYFQGGVWRYAAVHVGGLEALAEEVRAAVGAFGEGATEAQLHRVARIASLAHGARLMVEDAAARVEAPGAGDMAVALSLAAREAVETACLKGIAIADRALGTRSFATGQRAERVRRDLGFFLRQADLDGKLRQVGSCLCQAPAPIGEIWDREG